MTRHQEDSANEESGLARPPRMEDPKRVRSYGGETGDHDPGIVYK